MCADRSGGTGGHHLCYGDTGERHFLFHKRVHICLCLSLPDGSPCAHTPQVTPESPSHLPFGSKFLAKALGTPKWPCLLTVLLWSNFLLKYLLMYFACLFFEVGSHCVR